MDHHWSINARCVVCGMDGRQLAFPGCEICPGQPTPEPHLAAAYGETDGAWDRLRADLANLGVDAPAMTPQSPLTAISDIRAYDNVEPLPPVTSHENDSEAVERLAAYINIRGQHWFGADGRCVKCVQVYERHEEICQGTPLLRPAAIREARIELALPRVEPDYDSILLASRKRRERQSWVEHVDREDGRTCNARQVEHERAQCLEAAMSAPLTFEPRVGHKGCQIDE